jgi:hypothetical protein
VNCPKLSEGEKCDDHYDLGVDAQVDEHPEQHPTFGAFNIDQVTHFLARPQDRFTNAFAGRNLGVLVIAGRVLKGVLSDHRWMPVLSGARSRTGPGVRNERLIEFSLGNVIGVVRHHLETCP